MKKICSLIVLLLNLYLCNAQQLKSSSDIRPLISKIESAKFLKVYSDTALICDSTCKLKPYLYFSYYADQNNNELLKTAIHDNVLNSVRTYYFNGEHLIAVREVFNSPHPISSSLSFFTDNDFSIGTTYKDYYNDNQLLLRHKLMVDAYKLLQRYKTLVQNQY